MLTIQHARTVFREQVLEADIDRMPSAKAGIVRLLRVVYLLIINFSDGQLTLRAMSLVFTSLLALVPLLAVSFSVLKAFGVHNQAEPFLLNFFAPLGEKAPEVTEKIIAFVDNVQVGVLGSLGLALLFYTVVSLIHKVEQAFNSAWHVDRARPFASRFSYYLSVVLIGPVLVFSGLGLTASLLNTQLAQAVLGIGAVHVLFVVLGKLIPYLLIIAAFTFVYWIIPNTNVRIGPALAGGTVAGVLWESVGWLFAHFVVSSTHYTAIYSGFAIVIIFMVWLHLAWLILLVGANIAFYRQHPDYLLSTFQMPRLTCRLAQEAGLSVMTMIAREHYAGRGGLSTEAMAKSLGLPVHLLKPVLDTFENAGLLVSTEQTPPRYLPAKPMEMTTLSSVLNVLQQQEGALNQSVHYTPDQTAKQILEEVWQLQREKLGNRTVKDLVNSTPLR